MKKMSKYSIVSLPVVALTVLLSGCSVPGVDIVYEGENEAEKTCRVLETIYLLENPSLEEATIYFDELSSLANSAANKNEKYEPLKKNVDDFVNSFYEGNLAGAETAWAGMASECNIVLGE